MSDSGRYIILANSVGILDTADKARGWVRAEELLRVFGSLVSPTDLTSNSWIAEFVQTTLSVPAADPTELCRLQVR